VVVLMLALGPRLGFDFYAWRAWMLLAPLACLAAADILCRLARGTAGAALLVLTSGAALNLGAAAWFDFAGDVPSRSFWSHGAAPGPESPWFFLRGAPLFAAVVAAALALGVASVARRGWRGMAAALALAAHVLIAAPIRLRALTRFVEPLGYASPLEYRGYLGLLEHTRPGDRVLTLSGAERAAFVIGLDRPCAPWEPDEHALERRLTGPDGLSGLADWLGAHGYAYVVADPTFAGRMRDSGRDPAAIETAAAEQGFETLTALRADGQSFLLLRVPAGR
jgi:hypothetical protein